MKKLSLIVAMAVVLTIGGVFATWTYGESPVSKVENYAASSIFMDEADVQTKGTLAATGTITLQFNEDSTTQYKVVLDKTGTISIAFTPNVAADNAPENINVKITAKLDNAGSYDGKNIVKFSDDTTSYVVKSSVSTSDLTLAPTDFAFVVLANEFNLNTADEHGKFKTAAQSIAITLTVEEVA